LHYLVGETKDELGGSHFALIHELTGGQVPTVDPVQAKKTFAALHGAISQGLLRACHDLSEGGLAVAAAEMCFAGGIGAEIELAKIPSGDDSKSPVKLLFSESNTRFLCEVRMDQAREFEKHLAGIAHACVGRTQSELRLIVTEQQGSPPWINGDLATLKAAWKEPLAW
jgi:phosphoribosylformylglycinamidine synthase